MVFTVCKAQLHVSATNVGPSSGCTIKIYQSVIHAFVGVLRVKWGSCKCEISKM